MPRPARSICLLFLIALVGNAALAADKPTRLFSAQGEAAMTLQADWRTLLRDRQLDTRYPATMRLEVPGDEPLQLDVELSKRGKSRRDKQVCEFPPLKVHFQKDQVRGTSLRGISSLKLVTHCNDSKRYSAYYIKEFLAYRLYNHLTPLSFRVRALQASYTDSKGKLKPLTQFAFFIEDVDDMAKRNKLHEQVTGDISPRRLDPKTSSLFSVFQLLIGNLDWASTGGPDPTECCHNTKLVGSGKPDAPYFPVPYDFDASGLVDTHYALPPRHMGVRRITDRLYRGFCVHNDETAATLDLFRAEKSALLGLVQNESRLQPKAAGKALEYLEEFYELIDRPGAIDSEFIANCRG